MQGTPSGITMRGAKWALLATVQCTRRRFTWPWNTLCKPSLSGAGSRCEMETLVGLRWEQGSESIKLK